MQKLTIIKLGGSLITDKRKALVARERVITSLAGEISSAAKSYRGKLIIGHGSGSFGHASAAKYQTQRGILNKVSIGGVSEVADVATRLTKIVTKHLRKAKLPVVAFAPASFILSERLKAKKFFLEPIKEALRRGITPLVYGDVVFDKSQGFGIFSTEKVINVLAKGLKNDYQIERIIYCGDTNGVLDSSGKAIEAINSVSFPMVKKEIGLSKGVDVTGGMLHKVQESLSLVKKYKTRILIINSRTKGVLRRAILGKKVQGTLIF